MARNLPAGCSVSDLPGNDGPQEPPGCFTGGCERHACAESMEDGYPLCDDHDTPEARGRYDDHMERRQREHEAAQKIRERAGRDPPEQLGTPEVFLDDDGTPRWEDGQADD